MLLLGFRMLLFVVIWFSFTVIVFTILSDLLNLISILQWCDYFLFLNWRENLFLNGFPDFQGSCKVPDWNWSQDFYWRFIESFLGYWLQWRNIRRVQNDSCCSSRSWNGERKNSSSGFYNLQEKFTYNSLLFYLTLTSFGV